MSVESSQAKSAVANSNKVALCRTNSNQDKQSQNESSQLRVNQFKFSSKELNSSHVVSISPSQQTKSMLSKIVVKRQTVSVFKVRVLVKSEVKKL